MNKNSTALTFAACLLITLQCNAQTQTPTTIVPISLTGTTYTQNFNTDEAPPNGPGLANTGTSTTVPPGWGFVESGTSASNDGIYSANDGSSSTVNTYSYGTVGSNDRAFGELSAGTFLTMIGGQFINSSTSTITAVTIAYTGEQWREGSGGADRLDFKYSTDATLGSLTVGTFNDFNSLDFNAPLTGTTATLDGNLTANRTTLMQTITGLNVLPGGTFTIRWDSIDATGNDSGLSVDDLSMSFAVTAIPEPSTWVIGSLFCASLLVTQRKRFKVAFATAKR